MVLFDRDRQSTGTHVTAGRITPDHRLEIVSEMDDGGVLFGDGIEDDRILFTWGMRVEVRVADVKPRLVV